MGRPLKIRPYKAEDVLTITFILDKIITEQHVTRRDLRIMLAIKTIESHGLRASPITISYLGTYLRGEVYRIMRSIMRRGYIYRTRIGHKNVNYFLTQKGEDLLLLFATEYKNEQTRIRGVVRQTGKLGTSDKNSSLQRLYKGLQSRTIKTPKHGGLSIREKTKRRKGHKKVVVDKGV